MQIKTWIEYEEQTSPGVYKPRSEYIDVELKEVSMADMKLAFEDKSPYGKGKIYYYNNKLWCLENLPMRSVEDLAEDYLTEHRHTVISPLEYLKYYNTHSQCVRYHRHFYDRDIGIDTSRNAVVNIVTKDMDSRLLVNGDLYWETNVPQYRVVTYGLDGNHGGTHLLVDYGIDSTSKESIFSALDSERAIAYANKVATERGDTNNIGKFCAEIVVHMPELVT